MWVLCGDILWLYFLLTCIARWKTWSLHFTLTCAPSGQHWCQLWPLQTLKLLKQVQESRWRLRAWLDLRWPMIRQSRKVYGQAYETEINLKLQGFLSFRSKFWKQLHKSCCNLKTCVYLVCVCMKCTYVQYLVCTSFSWPVYFRHDKEWNLKIFRLFSPYRMPCSKGNYIPENICR